MSLFRERLLARLVEAHAISHELVAKLLAWRHPGFSAHVGEPIGLAHLSDHIPDPGQHRTLFYGEYSSRVRGSGSSAEPEALVAEQPQPRKRSSPSWGRLIAKVYQVDPLLCTRCGKRMSLIAFVTDQVAIGKILDHLGLSTPEAEKPPPLVPELLRVAEHGDGWGVPAQWDPA